MPAPKGPQQAHRPASFRSGRGGTPTHPTAPPSAAVELVSAPSADAALTCRPCVCSCAEQWAVHGIWSAWPRPFVLDPSPSRCPPSRGQCYRYGSGSRTPTRPRLAAALRTGAHLTRLLMTGGGLRPGHPCCRPNEVGPQPRQAAAARGGLRQQYVRQERCKAHTLTHTPTHSVMS